MIEFLLFGLIALVIQAVISLFEMASVSFSKVRLHYYVSLNHRRAIWLQYLLERPSRLFGTTLIGITAALQFGSEFARRWYEAMGWNPELAPISQILIVVIFGELAPMFAGRRHPERIAMALVPYMIFLTYLLSPLIWAFDSLSNIIHRWMGTKKEIPLYLSREEVQAAFEEQEDKEEEWGRVVNSIFRLKQLTVKDVMTPLASLFMLPLDATIGDVRNAMRHMSQAVLPLYHHARYRISGIVEVRDLIGLEDGQKVFDQAAAPWFIMQESSLLDILEQFRKNHEGAAVVLTPAGQASGMITLDQLLTQIFGIETEGAVPPAQRQLMVEKTVSGAMVLREFNQTFQADLKGDGEETLSHWILAHVEHPPVKGEEISIDPFVFTVLEITFTGIKTLTVSNLED